MTLCVEIITDTIAIFGIFHFQGLRNQNSKLRKKVTLILRNVKTQSSGRTHPLLRIAFSFAVRRTPLFLGPAG
jgi:hypothetical protein